MKNIFAAAVIATTALCTVDAVSASGAKASVDWCDTISGYTFCVDYESNYDMMVVEDPYGREETISVKCRPLSRGGWIYESEGQWTKASVTEFVEGYCEGRGDVH